MLAATIVAGRIEVAERPDPVPGAFEILVRVRGAGVNNADLAQIAGKYPAPPGSPEDIPGLELAGEVVGLGPYVTRFALGDNAMALVGGGGHAELAVVHERLAMSVPDNLDLTAAGCFPEAFITAHDALFTQCGLAMGERVLVHGAAGGVGTAAVQLSVAAGAQVTATVRSEHLRDRVAELGARVVAPDDFEGAGPFDVVLELVSAENLEPNLNSLATGGRIAVIGMAGGVITTQVNLRALQFRRAVLRGSTLRARPLEERIEAVRRVEAQVVPRVRAGRIGVVMFAEFALSDAQQAFDRFRGGAKFGKIALKP